MISFIGNHGVPPSKEARTSFPGGAKIEMLPESTRFRARRAIVPVEIKHRFSIREIKDSGTSGSGGIRPRFSVNGIAFIRGREDSVQLKLLPRGFFRGRRCIPSKLASIRRNPKQR